MFSAEHSPLLLVEALKQS